MLPPHKRRSGGGCCSLDFSLRALPLVLLVMITNYAQFLVFRQTAVGSAPAALSPSCAPAAPRGFSFALPTAAAGGKAVAPFVAVAGSPARRGAPTFTSEFASFCTPPAPGDGGALPAAVAAAQWDLVSLWPAVAMKTLLAQPCFLTTLNQQKDLGFLPVYICTHDPALDQVMAAAFHSYNWWGANNDHRFMLAAGYAGGTPMRAHEAGAMRDAAVRARAAGAPFGDVRALSRALKLPAIEKEEAVRSSCSRERPFVLDIGGNIGYYTLVAAATGCSVVTVEPLSANIGRLWQSVLANRFEGQVSLFKNAVGKDKRLVTLSLNRGNPGASFVSDRDAELPGDAAGVAGGEGAHAGGDAETVATVLLDELFDGAPHRPKHPFTGAPIAPEDVAIVKVDVEGFDAAALWALRGAIEEGRPPLIKVEYAAGDVKGASACDNVELIRWLYDLGYLGCACTTPPPPPTPALPPFPPYLCGDGAPHPLFPAPAPPSIPRPDAFGYGKPISLEMWEDNIIPLLLEGKQSELHEKHKMPIMRELYMVHEDAPVPAVMDSDGPKGGPGRGSV
jgi:FkbM family methyltransferase